MNEKRLDLAELQKLCTELDIGSASIQEHGWGQFADIWIGDGITIEGADIYEARKLMILLKALPQLIEMAKQAAENK